MHWPTGRKCSVVYFLTDNSDNCYGKRLQFHNHQKWEHMDSLPSYPSFLKVLIYVVSSPPLFQQFWRLLVLNTSKLSFLTLGLILCYLDELHRLRGV